MIKANIILDYCQYNTENGLKPFLYGNLTLKIIAYFKKLSILQFF